MQFQLLVEATLKDDQDYLRLRNKLQAKQQDCLKTATTKESILECKQNLQHFQSYLSEYLYQYKEKGRRICSESMKQQKLLTDKIAVKNQCVQFYLKSVGIFQDNVRDKLNSLVNNLDFSQL